MLKIVSVCFAVVFSFIINDFAKAEDRVKIAVTQIIAHNSLDAIRKGMEDFLLESGYKNGENLQITFLSAQGNITTATQIARKFAGEKPDVIVALSTPSAQTMSAATKKIPIVFAAVFDPVEAKLVPSLIKPGGNVTGVSDYTDIAENLKLLQKVKPELKKIGYLYNASEANSVSTFKVLKKLADGAGMDVIPSSAAKSSDVQAAIRALIGKVDVIFVPTDNTIVSVLEGAAKVALETKTPLFVADSDTIGRGPFITQGVDYYDMGIETGKLILRILKGEKPGDIDVVRVNNNNMMVDMKVAKQIGVMIPQTVLESAVKVLQ
ncbi:ABC transporter substrate-binding protein [Bartonella sp. F02]|uniref:ABC transporter substrate-binding protein n=1 Tax=Bartonella sp. F02 TaxID=2967262 RepID=UPI0022A9B953|nr:ABC transporter substrate-binding protein [Bartonella sp. F02]MCZ2327892.1 ABC transporter substrate-binding protein [Bartonella sp. F02]